MKALSDATMITVVTSLLNSRDTLLERAAFWKARAEQQPQATENYTSTVALLEKNYDALRELADEAAPWIKSHRGVEHLFKSVAADKPNKENT